MGTLGRSTRNGKKVTARRVEVRERPHPAIAKLAVALKESKEAAEQQAATADILSALSRSSSDPQPVFEAIVEHAHRLCGAVFSILYRYDGKMMTVVADRVNAKASRILRALYPAAPRRDHIVGRGILEGRVMHSSDIPNDPRFPANRNAFTKAVAVRAGFEVPLLRNGTVLGAIAVGRLEARPFSKKEIWLLKTFADQAVIAMEKVRLFNETKEALERQTATAEILKVISSSPTDVQPVFDAITENAIRLVGGFSGVVTRRIGDELHLGAFKKITGSGDEALKSRFPQSLSSNSHGQHARAILTRAPVHIADTEAPDAPPSARELARARGYRSVIAVPLLRDAEAIGTIGVSRRQAGAFSKHQIDLLKTFADQAVIAIENVRLFNETKEALEHQKASADILRVIAGSIENTDPAFEAITRTGMRLIPGSRMSLILVRDGELHYVSHSGIADERRSELAKRFPLPLDRQTVAGTAILDKRMIHVPDFAAEGKDFPLTRKIFAKISGFRAMLAVPLVRNHRVIGAINVSRETPGPFSEKQIALANTFASQAVIAIQNARMFHEIQERNAELKQALDFQGASGEILSSISNSITDAQPVFDAIVRSLLRLFGTRFATVALLRDGQLQLTALQGEKGYDWLKETYPQPLSDWNLTGRAILSGQVLQLTPCIGNPAAPMRTVEVATKVGFDSIIAAPMIREGKVIGSITTARREAVPFDEKQVALLKAFADQAVIAIENARLFNETKEALDYQKASAEVLEVISGSMADAKPVYDKILESCRRLFEGHDVGIALLGEDGMLHLGAWHGTGAQYLGEKVFPMALDRESGAGMAMLERRVMHFPDIEGDEGVPAKVRMSTHVTGIMSAVIAPMLWEGRAIGSLYVGRSVQRAFSEKEIALVKTFADQAVIAIQNARLFNETKESLEQQTATAEILKVISSSPTATQPVFEAIVESAARLSPPCNVAILMRDGAWLHRKANAGPRILEIDQDQMAKMYPLPFDPQRSVAARALVERRIIEVPDTEAPEQSERTRAIGRAGKYRSVTVVPLIREGEGIGAIGLSHPEPGFKLTEKQLSLLRTFASQAVIAIENVRLFKELEARNKDLGESLEQQTATAEILGVISSSPTDVQPVFDAIIRSAVRLCGGLLGTVLRFDGKAIDLIAHYNLNQDGLETYRRVYPTPVSRDTVAGCALLDRAVINLPDSLDAKVPARSRAMAEASGFRSVLVVPMLREGQPIGVINVARSQSGLFSDAHVELLKTFAGQAVIAIENVRLFNETKQALERQTATSEILRVISSSPTDIQPVFDAVVESAARLCDAPNANVFRVEGDVMRKASQYGSVETTLAVGQTRAITPGSISGRAILERRTVHVEDALALIDTEYAEIRDTVRREGLRTVIGIPLLREGVPIGAITVYRTEVRPFSDEQVALLQTFAAQAVIAIENVRLFNETKNALARQTATAEILRVLGSSVTDVQPVFDAIVKNCHDLFKDSGVVLRLASDGQLHVKASVGYAAEPVPIERTSAAGACVIDARTIHLPDLEEATKQFPRIQQLGPKYGYRSLIYAPLMRGGQAIGAIGVLRRDLGAFDDKDVQLLKTFAGQAVIAVENVRLFNETKEALEQQTAISEVLRVISDSPTDVKPVLDAVAVRAAKICEASDARIWLVEDEGIRHAAGFGDVPMPVELGDTMGLDRDTVSGRAIIDRAPVHIEDMASVSGDEYATARKLQASSGFHTIHTILAVPLMREQRPLGAIMLRRMEVRSFTDKQIALLKTFADQAAIAIENVRLFNETKEALDQQTSTAEVLKTISRSTFDLDSVLQTLLDNATRLSGAARAAMLRPDAEGNFVPTVTFNYPAGSPLIARMREQPIRPGRGSITGRVLLEKKPIHVPDVLADPEYQRGDLAKAGGFRTVLAVPMLRDGEAIGLIALVKGEEVDPFTDKQMEIVTTFADQAVIAIENVRLFKEIEEKSAQLEIANKHKSDFLANMSHELRTPLNAIIGFSEALMEKMFGELNEKQADYLRDIHESGKHLLSLINDILDLSKIEAGRMELELSSFHLPSALSNAMTLIRERAQRHAIELGLEVDERLGEFQADERKFKQIMLNLLSNAVKFTPDGGRVDVRVKKDTDKIEIAVKDTGIGIAPEDQAAVFEEFKQVGRDQMRKAEGTGLGLALTKRFIELHGGVIRLESTPGKGSTFAFTLPLRQ